MKYERCGQMNSYEFLKRIANFKNKEPLRMFLLELAGKDVDEIDEASDAEFDDALSADIISKEQFNEIAKDYGEEEI